MKRINYQSSIFACVLIFTIMPTLAFAQEDSFSKTIDYLSTGYLDNMQQMSIQTSNDLTYMSQTLSYSINVMLINNKKAIDSASIQLNNEIITQLMPELKRLRETSFMMNQQLQLQFNQ